MSRETSDELDVYVSQLLAHFQEITGIEDQNRSLTILEEHGWNLEAAVQDTLNKKDGIRAVFHEPSPQSYPPSSSSQFHSHDDVVVEEDGKERKLITWVPQNDLRYNAAKDLISTIDADSLDGNAGAGTMKSLKNHPNFHIYETKDWANSARLDNQGNYNAKIFRYARLAVQINDYTVAQANVKTGVNFGRRRIRNAIVESLNTGEIVYLHN